MLPQIREQKPDCSLAVVGRNPTAAVLQMAEKDPLIKIHADVPDIRPYLWGARVAVVPLKVGGGTRLKVYEAMAAGTPQVSTTIGAEGLLAEHGENILLAERQRVSRPPVCSRLKMKRSVAPFPHPPCGW